MKNYPLSICLSICLGLFTACSQGLELDCRGKAGRLHKALDAQNPVEALAILQSKGKINVHGSCKKHSTMILVAARHGFEEVVGLLLERGADMNAQCSPPAPFIGPTPLTVAVDNGHIGVVKLLLERGADIEGSSLTGTPLIHAANNGHIGMIKLLLERGADIHATGVGGDTAFIAAAYHGHIRVVKLLIERGSNIEKTSLRGYTVLMKAAEQGRSVVVKMLLQCGADIERKNLWVGGTTALMFAILDSFSKRNIPTLKALIDAPQNFHLTNGNGQTALDIAEARFKEVTDPAGKCYYSLAIALLKQKMRP